jgi:nucleoid-associated protein YgaU
MGLFGASFEDKVAEAIGSLRAQFPAVGVLSAKIDGKVVTLSGEAPSLEVKTQVMAAFNALVDTENTINTIRITPAPAPAQGGMLPMPAAAPAGETVHVVVSGDTLSGIAKNYYGKAGLYMKIFEANKDILTNPDVIKVGQKLRIPS